MKRHEPGNQKGDRLLEEGSLSPSTVLQALQRAGFFIHHTAGSHYILKHPEKPNLRVCVAYHSKDLKRRTLESIIEQAGLTNEEFLKLL